jgi:hypothetical protein
MLLLLNQFRAVNRGITKQTHSELSGLLKALLCNSDLPIYRLEEDGSFQTPQYQHVVEPKFRLLETQDVNPSGSACTLLDLLLLLP